MDADLEHFEKFIIKQIVNTVEYNPESDEYKINRIHISDEIIQTILNEGKRYGLEEQLTREFISRVANNIRTSPSIKLRHDNIIVSELDKGQHLRVIITHPEKGKRYAELVVLKDYHFFLLSSDIMGLEFGDILVAVDKIWCIDFFIEFLLLRKEERIPNKNAILKLGKVLYVELYSPSIINDILDDESSFTFESQQSEIEEKNGKEEEQKKENDTIQQPKCYYFWMPNKWKPISFSWNEGDAQDEKATFIITDYGDTDDCTLSLNNNFDLFQQYKHLDYFIKMLNACTKFRNDFFGTNNLKYIKSVKHGVAKRTKSELNSKEWEIVILPQIKFIYE